MEQQQTGSKAYLFSIVMVAVLGGLLFGYDTAVISGAEKGLQAFFKGAGDFEYTDVMHGFTSSSALIGCIIGSSLSGLFASRLGRKRSLIFAGVCFFLSAWGSMEPESYLLPQGHADWTLLVVFNFYRVLGGIGVGMASAICPMYIGEIAPSNVRGMLVSFGNASGPVPPIEPLLLSQKGSLYLTRPVLWHYTARREDLLALGGELFAMVASGKVKIEVNQTYALADVASAHRDLEASAELGEFLLKLRRADAVLVGEVRLFVDGVLFLHHIVQTAVTHDNGIHNHVVIVFEMILFQHGETLTGGDDDITFGGVQLTGQDLQKGGFTGIGQTDNGQPPRLAGSGNG